MTTNRISRPGPGVVVTGHSQAWAPAPQKSGPMPSDLAARRQGAAPGFGPRLAKLPPPGAARHTATAAAQPNPQFFQPGVKLPAWPQRPAPAQAMPQQHHAGVKAPMFQLVVTPRPYAEPPPSYPQALRQPPLGPQFTFTHKLPPPPPYPPPPQPSTLRPLPMFPQGLQSMPYRPGPAPLQFRPSFIASPQAQPYRPAPRMPLQQPAVLPQPLPPPPPYHPSPQWPGSTVRPPVLPQHRPLPQSPGLAAHGAGPSPAGQHVAPPLYRPGAWSPVHADAKPPLGPTTASRPPRPAVPARPVASANAAAATQPASTAQRPSGPTGNLAHMNLAARIKTTHLQVPQMEAQITFDDPKGLAKYGGTKENVVLQRLQMKAFEALNAASFEIKEAVEAYDRDLAKRPPASPAEQLERQKTFETVCKQILQAQEAKVNQLVQDEWAMQKHRDSALVHSNLRFGTKMLFNTTKLVASASTMATVGASPLGVASAAYTCFNTVQTIKSFMQDRDAARKSILKHDAVLAQQHQDKLSGAAKGKRVGAELIAAMHLPFTKKAIGPTVVNQENKLEEFLAKSARVDRQARKLYQETNQLLQQIEKARSAKPDDPKLQQAGIEATQMLDKLADLMQSIERDNQFYLEHKARCEAYRGQQPVGLKPTTDAVETAAFAGQIGRFANNLHTIATNLA